MSYQPASGYEHAYAENQARRGPLRFEEGVATDTDVPYEFGRGAYGDTDVEQPGSWAWSKDPGETQRERAHLGSATWIEAPTELNEFVQGASMDHPSFERVQGSETRIQRPNPAVVGAM